MSSTHPADCSSNVYHPNMGFRVQRAHDNGHRALVDRASARIAAQLPSSETLLPSWTPSAALTNVEPDDRSKHRPLENAVSFQQHGELFS
jgi:hypothetical protein